MALEGKCALITGSSRGIGRSVALKLAECGVTVAVHYHKDESAAADTLARVRERGADGCAVRADVSRPEDLSHMFDEVRDALGGLDIFVANARPDLPTFYCSPMELALDHWRAALDTQAQAFLLGAQEAARLMPDGSRIIAVTYSPGGRTGSWQPWGAMGSDGERESGPGSSRPLLRRRPRSAADHCQCG